jgi:hypothetical protein
MATPAEWKKRYAKLVATGRINDPTHAKGRKDITEDLKEDNYVVPTIDAAPKGEKESSVKKVKRPDVVQMFTF